MILRCCLIAMLFIFLVALSCTPSQERETDAENQQTVEKKDPLEGKWRLVAVKQGEDADFVYTPDSINYFKLLVDDSFMWVRYVKGDSGIIGTAGGTYTVEGGKYTEDIHYFYPPGSSLLGASVPFKWEIKDGTWYHSGYINQREYDEEIGDYVVTGRYKLEEIWERVEE